MESCTSVDSISIQILNINYYEKEFFNQFYQTNNLHMHKVKNDGSPALNIYRFTTQSDFTTNLFHSTHSGTKYNSDTYTTFSFSGLKSYKNQKDVSRTNILHKFIDFLSSLKIRYKLVKIDLSFDFDVDNKLIENFLPIRTGARKDINDPFNYFETTLYVENRSVSKPSVKAYLYDKSVKENLNNKIIRFEISIRNLKISNNDYVSMLAHINKQLSNYKLFYFNSKSKCDTSKRIYRDNIPVSNKVNFPISLEKRVLDELSGKRLDLSISTQVDTLLKKFFTKNTNPIMIERKIPSYIKNLQGRKDKS